MQNVCFINNIVMLEIRKYVALFIFVIMDTIYLTSSQFRYQFTEPHTIRIPVEPSALQKHYNPSYGYEPYWENGEWVFQDVSGDVTQKQVLCLNEDCSFIYKRVGPVCTRRLKATRPLDTRCDPWSIGSCTGIGNFKYLEPAYRTFYTYCDFLRYKCGNRYLRDAYTFLHVGRCTPPERQDEEVHRNMSHPNYLVSRKRAWIRMYRTHRDNMPTTSTPGPEYYDESETSWEER